MTRAVAVVFDPPEDREVRPFGLLIEVWCPRCDADYTPSCVVNGETANVNRAAVVLRCAECGSQRAFVLDAHDLAKTPRERRAAKAAS